MGKFEFWKVTFGLAQAPTYFQWLIDEVLSNLDFVFRYLDDILVYIPDPETHLKHVEVVFQCLLKTGLMLKEIKHNFLKGILNIWVISYLKLVLNLYRKH